MKKFKLFTTIASLCLAVALMAFGVYAATQVDVTISGTVSFGAAANVKATVTLSDTASNVASGYTQVSDKQLYKTGENANEATATGEYAYSNLTFTADNTNTNIVFTYTVTVANNAGDNDQYQFLKVVTTNSLTTTATLASEGYTAEITGDLANGGTIAKGESKTYTVKLTINPNRTVSGANIGSAIKLTMVESAD